MKSAAIAREGRGAVVSRFGGVPSHDGLGEHPVAAAKL